MGDLDVGLRLHLDQNVDKEGRKAASGLKKINDEANKLGRVRGADELERDLKDVSRSSKTAKADVTALKKEAERLGRVKTDRAQSEFRQLGGEADRTKRKIRAVNSVARSGKVQSLVNPMGRLHASAMGIASGLGLAFGASEIIRGMDAMKDKANELEAALTQLMLIEGEVTPEGRAKRQRKNDELAVRYGMRQKEILEAQNALAQGGLVGPEQDAVLEPILRTSKATGSASGTIAQAVRALMQNLQVPSKDIPAALDAMLAGGQAGSFELEDMASSFPELAAIYANSGRTGLDATTELVAMAQIVRENVGSSGEAGTALREILSKVYSPEIIKRMGEKGINVRKVAAKAQKQGEPLVTALIGEIEKRGLTDQFGLGELVGDYNARQALQALTVKMDKYKALLDTIRNDSRGSVDKNLKIVNKLGATKSDRRSAALEASGRGAGEKIVPIVDTIMDFFVRQVSKDYSHYQTYSQKDDKDVASIRSKIKEAAAEKETIEKNRSNVIGADIQLAELKQRLGMLEGQLRSIEEVRGLPAGSLSKDGDKGTVVDGKVKVPQVESPSEPLAPFKANLDQELQESKATVAGAVSEMRSMLNFSASPVISPIINSPGTVGAGNVNNNGRSTTKTTINGAGNPSTVAKRVTRRQNRALRKSRNGALHDTGAIR